MTRDEEREVAEIVGQIAGYESHCFRSLEEAQAFRKQALMSDDPVLYYQAQTINLQYCKLPMVFVVWVVRSDGEVAVRFRDGEIPLDVLRRCAQQGRSAW